MSERRATLKTIELNLISPILCFVAVRNVVDVGVVANKDRSAFIQSTHEICIISRWWLIEMRQSAP